MGFSQRPLNLGAGISAPSYDPASLTLSGAVPPGSTVTVLADGQAVGSAAVSTGGAWSYVFGSAPGPGVELSASVTVPTSGVTVPVVTPPVRVPPAGFTYLTDPDGARSKDPDGAYLMEPL